jgi:cytochrome c-type biogenesis protein CcmH
VRRMLPAAIAAVVVAALALALGGRDALRPSGSNGLPELEARALSVEQQLLCPQCTNKRLDTCEIEICQDMRREIRARLERGEDEQAVVGFFASRYGDRILAVLPKTGFHLWLWGWVMGSVLLVGASGAMWMRRRQRPSPSAPVHLDAIDERWLDAQLGGEPTGYARR